MKDSQDTNPARAVGNGDARGVSIVEMLIVVVIISIVTAFAVMQIAGSQRAMRLTNSAREFMGWVEKARLDSLRRHAMSSGEMASVTIASANSYSILIDQNGDGALDPPRTITIPATHGATFSGVPVPVTVRFNWRGRPVDASGHLMSLAFSLRDANGNINPINLTSAGDASLGDNVEADNVNVSEVSPTANIKAKTSVP
jgi:prepilin-type N-terminal cleavage/methylation domain-containing protein